MTSRQTTLKNRSISDLDIHGIGYLNRVREVTPENGFLFSVTIAALRGSADNVQHTHFGSVSWSVKRRRIWYAS